MCEEPGSRQPGTDHPLPLLFPHRMHTHTPGVPGILFSTLAWAVANALMGVHNVEPLLNELGTLQSV